MKTPSSSSPVTNSPGAFSFKAFLRDGARLPGEQERQWPAPPPYQSQLSAAPGFSLRAFLNLPPRVAAAPEAATRPHIAWPHGFFHWHTARAAVVVLFFFASSLQANTAVRQRQVAQASAGNAAAAQQIIHTRLDRMLQALATQDQSATGASGTTSVAQSERIAMARDYLYSLAANGTSVATINQWTGAMENNQITPGMSDQLVQAWRGPPLENHLFSTAQGSGEIWTYRPLDGSTLTVTFVNHTVVAVR